MRNFLFFLLLFGLCGCSSELTQERAIAALGESSAFSTPFFAPFNVGPQVLTAENYKNPEGFIRGKYGKLIDAGLVEVKMMETNSWRSVISVELTPAGMKMADMRRSDHDHIYVMACMLAVDTVSSVQPADNKRLMTLECDFHETMISPFGEYLGFAEGKPHKAPFAFEKSKGRWKLVSDQQKYFPQ